MQKILKNKIRCNKCGDEIESTLDAENGGVSVSAHGCEQYMSILRYGQYGQVGADGVWRNKESENEELKHASVLIGLDIKEYARIMEYLEIPRSRKEIQEFCGYKSRDSFMKNILNPLIDLKKVNSLLGMLDTIAICPVAFEILERLKKSMDSKGDRQR